MANINAEKAAAIYAYCLDDKEEDYCILCAKRVEGDEKGKWTPPMGHLHVDESPKDGAVRECEEESGVKIPKSQLLFFLQLFSLLIQVEYPFSYP